MHGLIVSVKHYNNYAIDLPSKSADGGDVLSKPADDGGGVNIDPRAGHDMGPDWS